MGCVLKEVTTTKEPNPCPPHMAIKSHRSNKNTKPQLWNHCMPQVRVRDRETQQRAPLSPSALLSLHRHVRLHSGSIQAFAIDFVLFAVNYIGCNKPVTHHKVNYFHHKYHLKGNQSWIHAKPFELISLSISDHAHHQWWSTIIITNIAEELHTTAVLQQVYKAAASSCFCVYLQLFYVQNMTNSNAKQLQKQLIQGNEFYSKQDEVNCKGV